MGAKTKLKQPIELVVSARDSGGILCAVAKTVDDGSASVRWDYKTKSWVFAKGLPVGTVFAARPASTSRLMVADVRPYMAESKEEEIIYLDKHGKKMQPPPTLDLKNFTWKKFFRWLNYIWSEKTF